MYRTVYHNKSKMRVCTPFRGSVCLNALFEITAGWFCTIIFGGSRGSSGECEKKTEKYFNPHKGSYHQHPLFTGAS